jgi:hypothetical protein
VSGSVHWVDGAVADFPLNVTRRIDFDNPLRQPWDGVTALTGVYARNEGRTRTTPINSWWSVNCHLGCPVTWFPQSGLFVPLPRRRYYANGERASGPPRAACITAAYARRPAAVQAPITQRSRTHWLKLR